MRLVRPEPEHLPSYIAALEKGWSENSLRSVEASRERRGEIRVSPAAFLARMDDPEGKGPPVLMVDGSYVPRLPGIIRWMWDGEFAGSIGLRWQTGSAALPEYCLGHIGYGVVPWRQRRGYAKSALAQMLPEARKRSLPYVELVTDPDNWASQRVVIANGGVLVEHFEKGAAQGGGGALRYRIDL